jgi:crotonobetainyl-CoA:carnitine CoA-transferase CaiB-like acyl-CoA transferase
VSPERLHPSWPTPTFCSRTSRARAAALGLDPPPCARRTRLIHVVMADFGLVGPRAGWRLEALPAFAASGALYSSGFPDRPPCWLPGYAAHDAASLFAVVGALAAVIERARHGRGQTVDVSVQEAAIQGLHPWSIPSADYVRVYPMLTAVPLRAADGAYWVLPTADGYIRALPASPRQWKSFVDLIDVELLREPEWNNALYRLANADVIRLLATEALRERPRAEVLSQARELDVPLVALNHPDDFVEEEQTRGRSYFRQTDFRTSARPVRRAAVQPGRVARDARLAGAGAGCRRRVRTGSAERGDGQPAGAVGPPDRRPRCRRRRAGDRLPLRGARRGSREDRVARERRLPPPRDRRADAFNRSWTFNDASRGQRSVCLDLRTARARRAGARSLRRPT